MEQVQVLLDDPKVHVAAPVVLAGAALEEFLRSMLATTPAAVVVGRPGIQAYAEALRKVEVLAAQDVKDITAWAAQRRRPRPVRATESRPGPASPRCRVVPPSTGQCR
jgi:hypothetical protein